MKKLDNKFSKVIIVILFILAITTFLNRNSFLGILASLCFILSGVSLLTKK